MGQGEGLNGVSLCKSMWALRNDTSGVVSTGSEKDPALASGLPSGSQTPLWSAFGLCSIALVVNIHVNIYIYVYTYYIIQATYNISIAIRMFVCIWASGMVEFAAWQDFYALQQAVSIRRGLWGYTTVDGQNPA